MAKLINSDGGKDGLNDVTNRNWINLNSMLARLFGLELFDDYRIPVWTFKAAFEMPKQEVSGKIRKTRILAAAQYADHSAQALYKLMNRLKVDKAREMTSILIEREKVCSLERWYCWKNKFSELAVLSDADDVQAASKRAYRAMDEVDYEQTVGCEQTAGRAG